MTWLDEQAQKSVIYVSFGSMTMLSREELIELWYGLVNSKKNFLWVVRPNSVAGDGQNIPAELLDESIVAAVPMICWPYYANQQVNSRLVGEVWKLGFDMKDICDRVVVETIIKDLMDVKRAELKRPVDRMMKLARRSVAKDGSSYSSLNRLIEFFHLKKKSQMDDVTISLPSHIVVFPSPIQWPVNTMFDLAEFLCLSGLHVTFLLTPYTNTLLIRHFNVESRLNPYPIIRHLERPLNPLQSIHLHTISDGLSPDHPRSDATELLDSMETLTEPIFKDLLTSGRLISDECGPVSCIISDGFMTFVYDVAKEIQVPVISALSLSPCSLWLLSNLPNPTSAGEVSDPMRGSNDDLLIRRVPGMDGILTGGDLASMQEVERMIPLLNYTVEENNNCIMWLDPQQPKSILYVSIENQAQLKWAQTLELWHGLVNSETRFLWVRRPESILGECRVSPKILKGMKERGCIVDSASNLQVLAHKAIGWFLTFGQWDSVIQGIVEGVPTICCPSSLDQQVNSKFVSKAWKIGLDVEWRWERNIIEKMIRDVMELKGELIDNANKMKYLSRKSVRKGGSSYAMLDRLANDIRFMHNGL
ncbi:hypothetical protein L1987_35204 [Smallanthus sonchifolius]|uniref:Uncharacterized protein n=1 Tax=Smallanthus sonchifolius TaxID=185202 RepID=A0ACB9HVD5_9ASTR|nr:hypothetical protein L1987_35204 [Smallanthus sonchifolius]